MSNALDLARNISTTFILAGIEELIKAYLVVLFRDTRFRIPSYFLFFGLECVFKTPVVYEHTLELGAGPVFAVLGTLFVVVSSTSFHIFTSLVYAKARWIYAAIFYCTLVHFASNFTLYQLPTLPLYSYTLVLSLPYTLAEVVLLFGYYYFERRINSAPRE
ncbi:hypothetical protein [Phyllobacterium sp.]|uniref:hypothetical protein n=1 Tax=unclassified Phyllobacterium TaxID=2638441 RepID=UPI001AC01BC3|nr:hypothetical protein [Phyllobacterium sp.]MBQ9351063.1 hypothetical protein [Phyllobacterium sp.]